MLHPKNNTIDYGEQLIPPPGYDLVRAVGTTYSLDLETLMVLPVALFYSKLLDGHPDDLRYDMLEAITKASDKITVFYQNGQLKVPHKYHHLMAYWENGIEPITMPNHVSSFHPKVWVMRYESKGKTPIYRMLVTSRNLTFNRDWDVAFSTEGTVQESEQAKNKPLVHFLQYLNGHTDKKIANTFLNDLNNVKFDLPEHFNYFKFVPIGIEDPETKDKYPNPLTTGKNAWEQLLIISPFLDKTTLKKLQAFTMRPPYLLSRKEEMDGVDVETLQSFNNWQFSKFIQEAEHREDLSENEEPMDQHLHAKLFVSLKDGRTSWYLGSANCSDPAQCRNVEFMIELRGTDTKINPKNIFRQLTDETKSDGVTLFTPYDFNARVSVEEQKRIDLDVRKIKYDLGQLFIKGEVLQVDGATAYNLSIEIDARKLRFPEQYQIKLKPLPEKNRAAAQLTAGKINSFDGFTGYPETSLSPFLDFEITRGDLVCSRFVLWMDIQLPEGRLNRIFTSIINSKEKFLKYLTFLLTGEESEMIDEDGSDSKGTINENGHGLSFEGAPVYERLLIAASRFPGKLRSIDTLIERLKSETTPEEEPIVTKDFETFWGVFQNFMEQNKKS